MNVDDLKNRIQEIIKLLKSKANAVSNKKEKQNKRNRIEYFAGMMDAYDDSIKELQKI